jgi:hypothetical protein
MRLAPLAPLATLILVLLAAPLAAYAQASGRVPRVGALGNARPHLSDVFEHAMKDLKALGLTLPPAVLARADEIIE